MNEVLLDDFDFVRTRGADASSMAPPTDHTNDNDQGKFQTELVVVFTLKKGS